MSGSNDALEALQAQQALQASQPQPQAQPAQGVPTAAAPPPIMQDQPWQQAQGAQPEDVSGSFGGKPAAAKGGTSLMDYGKQAWSSWLNTVDGGLGAASFAARKLGASPDTVAHIEQMRRNTEQSVTDTVSSMSPDAQRAAHASIFGGQDADGSGEHIPTPGEVGWGKYLGMTAASFVPDALMAIVPGGIAGRLGMKIAGEVGAKVASTAATGGVFGTVQAGDAYESFVKDIDNSKPADWQGNPVMDHMLEQGMSFNDAKKQIVGQAANHLVAMQAGIGAAMGAGGAGIIMKGPMASIAKNFFGRMGLSATEGAALMGGGAGAGDAANQSALQSVGLQKDLDTSQMARAAASGALGGAVLGAAGGLLHAPEAKAAPEHEETHEAGADTSMIDPATQAALNNHLSEPQQGALDLNQAPPGQNAGQPQGELFRTADQANQPVPPPAAPPPAPAAAPPPAAAPAAEQQLPTTQPGNAAPPAQAAAGPRPSDGMKVGELRDALKTMPDQDPKALARMSKTDLAAAYDKAQTPPIKGDPNAAVTTVVPGTITPDVAVKEATTNETQPELPGTGDTQPAAPAPVAEAEPAVQAPPADAKPDQAPAETVPPEVAPEPAPPAPAAEAPAAAAPAVEAPAGPKQTVSARLKAKQQMAAAGAKQKGEAYVAPEKEAAPTVVDRDREPRTHAEAMQDLRDGVEAAKRVVVPLKSGDLPRVMNQVMKELSDKLEGTKTEGDIHEAVSKWARADANPIPGSRTRRIAVGDEIMKLMTGKSVDEFADSSMKRGADVRGAMAEDLAPKNAPRASKGGADDIANRMTDTEGEASAGVSNYDAAEKPLPEKHADKLPAVLDRVLQGTMTVHEASDEIGVAKPGPGRPRTHATFADYLSHLIKQGEDPEAQKGLIDRMVAHDTTEYPTPQAKKAAGDRMNTEARLSNPENVQKLKDALNELDPAKAAVEEASTEVTRNRAPDTGDYAATMRTPEFNRVVDEKLADGQPHYAKEHLEAIAADPEVNRVAPQMASLARRLAGMVKDVAVETATGKDAGEFRYDPNGEAGTGRITINPDPKMGGRVESVVHESIHAVASHYLDSLPEGHPDRLAIEAIQKELQAAVDDQRGDIKNVDAAMGDYAASDPHETLTMLMTNPRVQQIAASARPSVGFRMQMLKLGYPLQAAKNMWAAFTSFVRRAMGLKGIATPADSSLLDYAIRPMTDIIERANEFNRAQFDDTPGLREVAHALPSFQDVRDATADAGLDRKTLDNKKMKLALPWATSDGMIEWNEKTFAKGDGTNPLREWRDAYESVSKGGKDFRDVHQDTVQDWVNDVAKLKGDQRDKLANLLVDVSTADKKVGPGLTDDAKLQARYDALAPATKKLYDQSVSIQNKMYAAKRAAELEGMLKGVMPGAPKAQLDAVRDAVSTKAKLDAFLADPNNHAMFGTNGPYKSVSSLAQGIAKIQRMGFVDGDYFPLQRDGDFIIHYGDKDTPDYGMEAFHSVAAAEARRAELAQKGTQDLSPVMSKRTNHLRNMIDSSAIDEVAAAMQRNGHSAADVNDMRDLLASVVMQHASRSEGMRSKLRRQGVLGASKEIEKVVGTAFDAIADHVGYAKNGPDLSQALQRMQDHTDFLGHAGDGEGQRTAQAVTNEAQLRRPTGDDGTSLVSKLLRRASPFGYMQSLGSLSTLFTHTTEAHMNSIPLLGARHGAGRASAELARALSDTLPATGLGVQNAIKSMTKGLKNSDYSLSKLVRDRLIAKGMPAAHANALFDSLNNAGLIDHTFARELKRIATNSQSVLGKAGLTGWWGRFMDATGAMSHSVDVANKSAIATAAFRLELKRTGDVDASVRYATDMARKAMPNYNQGNAARIGTAAGPLKGMAGPMMQFKKYGLHMYSMMGSLMHTWMHGASPAEQKEARNAFLGILLTHTAAAGGLTLIGDPIRWLGGAYDMLMSPDGKPRDREADIRQLASDWFGPTVGELMTRGAIETFAGQSVHQRIGLSNLLEPPELNSFDKKGFAEAGMSMLTGASGEDAATMAQGFMKMLHGDVMGGLVDTIPRFFRDPLKAYNLSQKGVTDTTGKTILPPEKLSPMDIADQAVGFTPSRVADFRAGRQAVVQEKSENSARKTQLIQGWLKADPEDKADAKDAINEWNHGHPGEKITVQQLLTDQAAQRKAAHQPPGSFGLKLGKGQARDLQGVGSFANYQ